MTSIRKAYGETLVTVMYHGTVVPQEVVDVLLARGGCVDRAVSWMVAPQLGADVSKTSALEINQASSVAQGIGIGL